MNGDKAKRRRGPTVRRKEKITKSLLEPTAEKRFESLSGLLASSLASRLVDHLHVAHFGDAPNPSNERTPGNMRHRDWGGHGLGWDIALACSIVVRNGEFGF